MDVLKMVMVAFVIMIIQITRRLLGLDGYAYIGDYRYAGVFYKKNAPA